MPLCLLIVLIVLGACLLLAPVLYLRRIKRAREAEFMARIAGERLIGGAQNANYFGRESLGMKQLRGNGLLALTQRRLLFLMLVPRRELDIPLETITQVELVRSHLGKAIPARLLKVRFTNEWGQADSAAWAVQKPENWKQAVEGVNVRR